MRSVDKDLVDNKISMLRRKLRDFSQLVMFEHTVFSASFILIAMIVSSNMHNGTPFFGFKILVLCIITLVSARNFAMSFNRICDRDIDARNERTKYRPSVDGRIGVIGMSIFCIANAIIFVLVSYAINDLAFKLSIPFLIILGFYSMVKRFSSLAHIILGLSLGLAPIAGDIAISGAVHAWSICLCIGVLFWVAGFDILYSLQDIDYDIKEKLHSIPARFGEKDSMHIARIFHVFAVFFWALFLKLSETQGIAIMGLIISAIMLIYEHIIVARDAKNIPKAFFVTNGYLGFVFLLFIIIDSIVRL